MARRRLISTALRRYTATCACGATVHTAVTVTHADRVLTLCPRCARALARALARAVKELPKP